MRLVLVAAVFAAACSPGAGAAGQTGVVRHVLSPANLPAFFDCLRENGRTIVVAHRGGPASGFPENAMSTFENTLRQVPAVLEIDIARTRDSVLILMHDETVDRTTTGSGAVSNLSLSQLQALRLKDEHGRVLDMRVPTLREALNWSASRALFELDVNDGIPYASVIAEVRAVGAIDRVIFITYGDNAAVRVHELAPEIMISASIDAASDLDVLAARGVDLTRVLAWTGIEEPNGALNSALAQRGVEAIFGTLGNPARSWDGRFVRARRDEYAKLAATGLAVISSNRAIEAVRDLDAKDGVDGYAALQCTSPDDARRR